MRSNHLLLNDVVTSDLPNMKAINVRRRSTKDSKVENKRFHDFYGCLIDIESEIGFT